MTDLDVIERLAELLSVGRTNSHPPSSAHYKPSWSLTISQRDQVFWLVEQVGPLLCSRRREATAAMLNRFRDAPPLPARRSLGEEGTGPWTAGIIEGDGHFRKRGITVCSVDRDVIERLINETGMGTIRMEQRRKPGHRDLFQWNVGARNQILELLNRIDPWLLSRRKEASARLRRSLERPVRRS